MGGETASAVEGWAVIKINASKVDTEQFLRQCHRPRLLVENFTTGLTVPTTFGIVIVVIVARP
jgi:hypothetical protein